MHPYLPSQIVECSIAFNARISGVSQSEIAVDTDTSTSKSSSSSFSLFGFSTSTSASSFYSSQKTTQGSNTEQREFSMAVTVHAVQDEAPKGMLKLLSTLEEAIHVSRH